MHDPRRSDDLLIDLIYAAMLGEASWQTFLEQLSASSPGGCSVLFSYDEVRADSFIGLYAGCDDNVVSDFESYYSALNPLAPHCAVRKPGLGLISHEIYPQEKLLETEFYNDFMLRVGLKSAAGCTILKDVDRSFVISTMTVNDDPEAISPVAEQFTRIAPHLNRAANFYRNAPALKAVTELGGALFDAMHVGMMIIGEGHRLKAASQAMHEMLVGSDLLRMSPMGRIRLRDGDAADALAKMLSRAYDGPKSLAFQGKEGKLTLIHVRKDRLSLYFEGPTVMLLLEPAGFGPAAFDPEAFSATYGLTASETRALRGIVDGRTVSDIADDAGLSRETIRSQVKSLYAKTGVRSEASLMRLVFTGRNN